MLDVYAGNVIVYNVIAFSTSAGAVGVNDGVPRMTSNVLSFVAMTLSTLGR